MIPGSLTALPTEDRTSHRTATPCRSRVPYASTYVRKYAIEGRFVRGVVKPAAQSGMIQVFAALHEEQDGFDLSAVERQLSEHAEQQGVNLQEVLDNAGRHFESEIVRRRLTPLTTDELDALAEDDERVSDVELSRVVR